MRIILKWLRYGVAGTQEQLKKMLMMADVKAGWLCSIMIGALDAHLDMAQSDD